MHSWLISINIWRRFLSTNSQEKYSPMTSDTFCQENIRNILLRNRPYDNIWVSIENGICQQIVSLSFILDIHEKRFKKSTSSLNSISEEDLISYSTYCTSRIDKRSHKTAFFNCAFIDVSNDLLEILFVFILFDSHVLLKMRNKEIKYMRT